MSTITETIQLALPLLGDEEADAVRDVILSGWVMQGPQVTAFEAAFARRVDSPHASAVSSGTASLHLALRAAGVGPGDEVVTVSHSFIATVNAIRYLGATPVMVDIEPDTFNMCTKALACAITSRTKAVLAVHQMGMPCDMAGILAIADPLGIPVIEDAACAIGSMIRYEGQWRPIGAPLGRAACFSFHPRKVLTTGEGGMTTTADPEWDRLMRLWRQHGMDRNGHERTGSRGTVTESYPELGYNYRLTDIQAAIGLVQLKRLDDLVAQRRGLAEVYASLLAHIPGLTIPQEPAWARSNWQSYCVRLPEGADQAVVIAAMAHKKVATRTGIMCAHREPSCRDLPARSLRESERAQDGCIVLPLHWKMTGDDVARVADGLRAALIR